MKPLLLSSLLLILPLFSCAQDEGFVSLFNGESLEGWKVSEENPESFFVEEGILYAKGGKAHLFYSGEVGGADFTNFELKLRVQTTPNSNSGVYFHTQYQAEGWPKVGFEAQVNSTHSDPKKTGSLYGIANVFAPGVDHDPFIARVAPNREIFLYQPHAPSMDGEWFDYHIIVVDNKITLKVNGRTTVEWEQPEDWTKTRRIGHGTVGIQAHDPNSTTLYKDIQIKVLD